jgi:hypothetical protein
VLVLANNGYRKSPPGKQHSCAENAIGELEVLAPCAVKIAFIDTLHLFPETIEFLREVEERYNFKALYYTPKDFSTFDEYKAVHGVDLPIRDIEECVDPELQLCVMRACRCLWLAHCSLQAAVVDGVAGVYARAM